MLQSLCDVQITTMKKSEQQTINKLASQSIQLQHSVLYKHTPSQHNLLSTNGSPFLPGINFIPPFPIQSIPNLSNIQLPSSHPPQPISNISTEPESKTTQKLTFEVCFKTTISIIYTYICEEESIDR
jgi:hypothetical protein